MNRLINLHSPVAKPSTKLKRALLSAALAGVLALGLAPQALKAQSQGGEGSQQDVLRDILADVAAGRKVSARVRLPLQLGFARGGNALYITPEVGVDPNAGSGLVSAAQSVARGFNANYIPVNFASLPNTLPNFTTPPSNTPVRDIYVFSNQGNVLSASPTPAGPTATNANYSPLWQVSLVSWNSGFTPTTLTSTSAVQAAAAAGQVTVTKTPIIVECSVVFSLSPGGVLPDAKIVLDAASFANGGAVKTRVSLPLQAGFFNNEPALYITPEVGVDPSSSYVSLAQTVAQGFNANFVPAAFTNLPGTGAVDDIFVFTNFTQGNVLASSPVPAGPGNLDPNYSPIWQISLVSWNPGFTPRRLTSQADITAAATATPPQVTITRTPIIVECSVMFTPGGGLLPGARITRDDEHVGEPRGDGQ